MQILKKNSQTLFQFFIIIFFASFLIIGLRIYDDYGPVSEEKNQIDAGHIIWAEITGDNSHYPELPSLANYMNRYYGQGATFITVLLEAAFGFTWDINRIWKLRRLWNFFCFFCALICFFRLLKKRFNCTLTAFLGSLNLILLPRMFPENFYNDRDPLFLSFLIFSFCAMMLFLKNSGIWTSILFGFFIALTVNIRMFGLILFIPIALIFFRYPLKRRWLIPVLLIFFFGWYILSPIAWKDPFGVIYTSIIHLTTKQRMLDTNGSSTLLFAGKYYPEQNLPWFYLPLWMLVSTPLTLLFFAFFGSAVSFRKKNNHSDDRYFIIDFSLAAFFALFMIGIPIIRPTLYSGWRHFYFLNLSLVWFATNSLDHFLKLKNSRIKIILLLLEFVSLVSSSAWMITAHPYEGIFYNPAFRKAAAGNFERDTGYISTMECLEYLAENSAEQKIEVMNANAYLPFSLIGLPKPVREKFSTIDWKIQRTPMRYIIFNYNNQQGNEQNFPYYAPIYSIERNGTKLAEIFQRTNNDLLTPESIIESIHTSVNDSKAVFMLSENNSEIWQGADHHDINESITITLKDGVLLKSLEIFPGDFTIPSENLRFYTSNNKDSEWNELKVERYGTNGWIFSSDKSFKFIKIQSDTKIDQPWQIRQLLFYGKSLHD